MDELRLSEALVELVDRARSAGRRLAAVGHLGLGLHGLPVTIESLDVVADGPPTGSLKTESLPQGGWSWIDARGLPVRWIQRADHYAPLYEALLEEAQVLHVPAAVVRSAPLAVAPLSLLATTLLAGRSPEDAALIVVGLSLGHLDPEALRATVRRWLGVYALDDLESLIQEAEWRAMRRLYEGGQEPH